MTSAGTRPYVVLETGRAEARDAQAESLRRAGFEVGVCSGPRKLPERGCPLLVTGDCAMIGRADAVVFDLDLADDTDREVLWLLRSTYPHLPVILEIPAKEARRNRHVLLGCLVVPPDAPDELAAAVERAVTTGAGSGALPEVNKGPAIVELARHGVRLVDHVWRTVARRPRPRRTFETDNGHA